MSPLPPLCRLSPRLPLCRLYPLLKTAERLYLPLLALSCLPQDDQFPPPMSPMTSLPVLLLRLTGVPHPQVALVSPQPLPSKLLAPLSQRLSSVWARSSPWVLQPWLSWPRPFTQGPRAILSRGVALHVAFSVEAVSARPGIHGALSYCLDHSLKTQIPPFMIWY
jgi:hypothetical protein